MRHNATCYIVDTVFLGRPIDHDASILYIDVDTVGVDVLNTLGAAFADEISSDDGTISLKRQIRGTRQLISDIDAIDDETVLEPIRLDYKKRHRN